MKREPASKAQTRYFRARRNPLFFNKLNRLTATKYCRQIAAQSGFAETWNAAQINQQIACAVHRPASRPGAD
jgi:hypothetical protein